MISRIFFLLLVAPLLRRQNDACPGNIEAIQQWTTCRIRFVSDELSAAKNHITELEGVHKEDIARLF
jgi:hypothetical protein